MTSTELYALADDLYDSYLRAMRMADEVLAAELRLSIDEAERIEAETAGRRPEDPFGPSMEAE